MSPPRVLIDCDPGIDDTFALFCALSYSDVAAVTTVSGNVPVEHTTRNAQFVIELAGAETPVFLGASVPLKVEPGFATEVHGSAGLGDRATPPSSRQVAGDAVQAIIDYVDAGDAVIVALGPLTNIAQAFLTRPDLPEKVAHLHWMGGSAKAGNVTPHAEFNSWVDPHAAKIVTDSAAAMTMYGLDLTHQVRLGAKDAASLRAAATPTSIEAANFLDYYEANGVKDGNGQPMHDPCAVLGATHPDLFEVVDSRIVVEVGDERRGQTTVFDAEPNETHHRAVTADAEAVRRLILDASISPYPAATDVGSAL